jgi:hypothetical protein
MVSGKNIPSGFGLGGVELTSSIEVIASEKGKPSASQIEDVRVASPVRVTALPDIRLPSTASEEDKKPDYDSPPDGGPFAWMQVLGGWILILNSR